MKMGVEVFIKANKEQHSFKVGEPNTDEERRLMHEYRYNIYRKYGYIEPNSLQQDSDEHDSHCAHFVATYDDKLVGTMRFIYGDVIPMRDMYYTYKSKSAFENETLFEIGRIISTPHYVTPLIPRHFVLLALFYYGAIYAKQHEMTMAVGGIKERVYKKLESINVPLTIIDGYELNYDPTQHNDPLTKFFDEEKSGKICPVKSKVKDMQEYYNDLFDNRFVFEKIDQQHLLLKSFARFNLALWCKKYFGKSIKNY